MGYLVQNKVNGFGDTKISLCTYYDNLDYCPAGWYDDRFADPILVDASEVEVVKASLQTLGLKVYDVTEPWDEADAGKKVIEFGVPDAKVWELTNGQPLPKAVRMFRIDGHWYIKARATKKLNELLSEIVR